METFKIVRYFDGDNEVVRTGLTLDEARDHCRRDDTHGEGWFDGYEEEESYLSGDDWNQGVGVTLKVEAESGMALSAHAGVPVLFYSAVA
jgi:hypothetical protein